MKSCLRNKICITIVFSILCFSITSCFNFLNLYYYERSIVIRLVNGSNSAVGFIAPLNHNRIRTIGRSVIYFSHHKRFRWIDMDQLDISDTTMANYAFTSAYDYSGTIESGKDRLSSTRYLTLEEMMPYDTMRVFVFDKKYEDLIENDLYLVRYDISIGDAQRLINEEGELEIHFPPDERMKDIKMWPKYEDVVTRNEPLDKNQNHILSPTGAPSSIDN